MKEEKTLPTTNIGKLPKEKTKEELLQKELLDMLTPDKDKMKIGNKVFISLEEVEKILNNLYMGDIINDEQIFFIKDRLKTKLGIK